MEQIGSGTHQRSRRSYRPLFTSLCGLFFKGNNWVVTYFGCAASLHLVVESGLIGLGGRPEVQLSEKEKQELKGLIDRGEVLPAKYRHMLFAEPYEAELFWPGKTHEVTSVVLPFQSIEQIDEPRSEKAASQTELFQMDRSTGRQSGGWTNKLIWGDNKLVLSSLKNGPLRREIENAGGLKLVYIDPPFDVGADFSVQIEVGDGESVTKEPSLIEEIAYRDTWGGGYQSYMNMIYDRLVIIHGLMHPEGSIYVHCDWRLSRLDAAPLAAAALLRYKIYIRLAAVRIGADVWLTSPRLGRRP